MNLLASGQVRRNSFASRLICVALTTTIAVFAPTFGANADSRSQAKRIHDRLAGVPPTPSQLEDLQAAVENNPLQAAFQAMEHPDFYNVTLKNFVAPWTTGKQMSLCRSMIVRPPLLAWSAMIETSGAS